MASITTDRDVNPSQLAHELVAALGGTRPLHVVGPRADGTTSIDAPGTGVESLNDAVAAHVADPNWQSPDQAVDPAVAIDEDARTADAQLASLYDKFKAGTLTAADRNSIPDLAVRSLGGKAKSAALRANR
jgi:hypothetical protein